MIRNDFFQYILILFCCVASIQTVQAQDNEFSAADLDFFENKVRPLLVQHCLECHGDSEEKIRGGLWMNSRAQLLAGGDSGPAIVPGKPEESLFIEAIHYESFEMPPEGQLSPEHLETFEEWIRRGAPDPRSDDTPIETFEIDIKAGKEFWSFQTLSQSAPPAVKNKDWVRTEIDQFILNRLEEKEIRPVSDANRESLLRRTYFALTGLPPSETVIQQFVTSSNELDVDLTELVNRLLDSPEFGERWGRHWLDVARFAESSGGGRSLMFPEAWRFRDYVIDAYNKDKPFDQFIKEQIAGDLLPFENQSQRSEHLVAAGFLTLGPTNYEQQDKELLRMEVIDEQVDTVGRTFMALTLGCARCHDHKFDPIPMRDYYAIAGIFKSTNTIVDGNVSGYVTQSLATEAEQEIQRAYQSKVKALTKKLNQAKKQLSKLGSPQKVKKQKRIRLNELRGVVIDNVQAKLNGEWKDSVYAPGYVEEGYIHDDGQIKGDNRALFEPQLETGGQYEVRLAYTPGGNRASNTLVVINHQDGVEKKRINQSQNPPIEGVFVSLGTYRFEANNVASVEIKNDGADGVVIVDAVQFLKIETPNQSLTSFKNTPQKSASNAKQTPAVTAKINSVQQRFDRLDKELKELKKTAPPAPDVAMSVEDANSPADGHLHIRGSVRNLGAIVPRGFLQVALTESHQTTIPSDASGRLELANWLASPDHPLTARVYVNRVWRHLFGRGLVETTDNFGKMGQTPSHPELLDFLAQKFVESGWSTKTLVREIMLSRVFRLSTSQVPTAAAVDPENRLLWRANRRRVDAEVLRDSILAVSGKLDGSAGGRTIRKITQYDLGYQFDTSRRSVYVPFFRNSMLDLFEVFDVANPNLVTGNRNTSTLPTQALFLMNSPWVIEQSQASADRILADAKGFDDRLRLAYLRIMGRLPSAIESELAREYLDSFDGESATSIEATESKDAWASLIHSLFASLDFRYID